MRRFQTFKGPRGVAGGSELSAAMAEPTKQERYTKLMEALEAFDEVEFEIQCLGYEQVKDKISNYCRKFALAEVNLKDEEIQCKEDFALFMAHSCFWQNLRHPEFHSLDQAFKTLRTVVDHLKVLLQPPVADWHKSKTLSALAKAFRQMSEQSDILNFYAGCRKVWVRCGDVIRKDHVSDFFSQLCKRLAQKMREDVIQVAKMALRTQQFKTIVNDDLSAAVKDFLNKVRIWCQNAGEAEADYEADDQVQCLECRGSGISSCEKMLMLCNLDQIRVWAYGGRKRVARGFSDFTTESQKLRDATPKLLDLSLASELPNTDPQPESFATSLSSWSMVDMADQEKTLEAEVDSIASCNSVDSQTSCLSASGGPHCFLPTCRFKCVEDETSLVREVLGKDAKLLKHVPLVTKIHL